MSGTIGAASATDYGLMASLVTDGAAIQRKLDALTAQASTGLVANTYAGLGGNARVSLDLNPELTSMQTWQDNINSATGSMQVTQTAMTQLQQIASNLVSQIDGLQGADGSEVDTIAASARDALTQAAGLLDTTDGNTYVFGGADTGNPPVPNPDSILSSGFVTQIATAVGNLSTAGASATAAATLAVASSNVAGTGPRSPHICRNRREPCSRRSRRCRLARARPPRSACWRVRMPRLSRPAARPPVPTCAMCCARWQPSAH